MKQNLKIKSLTILLLLLLSVATPMALAAKPESGNGAPKGKGKENRLKAAYNGMNRGNGTKHLYLYEKDENWDIVEKGSWAKISYQPHRDQYKINVHSLEADVEYSLINYAPGTNWSETPYPNPWPGEDSVEIGSGTPNGGGNLHLNGTWSGDYLGKIWLVLSSDFADGSGMIGWNPSDYLFEYDLVFVPE
jgi:hypothetical protein